MGSFLVNGFLIAVALFVWPFWLVGTWITRVTNVVQSNTGEAPEPNQNLAAFTGLALLTVFLTLVFTLSLEPLIATPGRAWVGLALAGVMAIAILLPGGKPIEKSDDGERRR